MTRIVAGQARGRRLRVPPGEATRPTSDRVREALFSSLESLLGSFDGLRVLDLYAGSGGLGLEVLSRGAAHVALVESDVRAVRTIRANVAAVGLPGAEVVHDRVERFLSSGLGRAEPDSVRSTTGPCHLVLADPPYALGAAAVETVLALLTPAWSASSWLAPGAVVVVERERKSGPIHWPAGLDELRDRAYGETVLWYGRSAGTTETPG